MKESGHESMLTLALRLGAFFCFAGWTWGHIYWGASYGVLLWNEGTFSLAERLGIGWAEFVGTGAGDGLVQRGMSLIGWWYLLCAIVCLTVRRGNWLQMGVLVVGAGLLVLLSYAKYLGAERQLPMFVEHGGQMLMPVLLILALALGPRHRATVATAMVAFVATFAGHGAYAIGWWPTPGNFHAMTTVILGLDHGMTILFLRIAGILDFVVCAGIFLPWLRVPSAIYAAAWGFVTALARPVAGMSGDLLYWGADQFLHETILRAPHFLIPLYLALLWLRPTGARGEDRVPEISPVRVDGVKEPSLTSMFDLTNPSSRSTRSA